MHAYKYSPQRITVKSEISKSFFFGHLHTFVTLVGACNGIPIARNTVEYTDDQIPHQFPKG